MGLYIISTDGVRNAKRTLTIITIKEIVQLQNKTNIQQLKESQYKKGKF